MATDVISIPVFVTLIPLSNGLRKTSILCARTLQANHRAFRQCFKKAGKGLQPIYSKRISDHRSACRRTDLSRTTQRPLRSIWIDVNCTSVCTKPNRNRSSFRTGAPCSMKVKRSHVRPAFDEISTRALNGVITIGDEGSRHPCGGKRSVPALLVLNEASPCG